MNTPAFTRHTKALAEVERIEAALRIYADAMRRSGGQYSTNAMHGLLGFCEAVIDHIDEGDCLAQAESLRDDLRIDPDPVQSQYVERLSPAVYGAAR